MHVDPYLFFDNNCEEAFNFYQQAIGGKIERIVRFGEMPESEAMPAADKNKIAHVCLNIDGGQVMGGDTGGPYTYEKPSGFQICLGVTDPDRAKAVFDGLSQGAQAILFPLAQTSWARLWGQVKDRFGTVWMINCP